MPHIEALKTFAYHLTYNESNSNDLVQDTYLKAFRFIEKYQKGTNAKAWLFKILKNAYINEYRKKVKRPVKVDFEEIISYHEQNSSDNVLFADLREDVFTNVMGDEVTMAMDALPEDFRTVILLCDIEGFTYEEIAKILEIPIGTVRSRLFRARNMLKDMLVSYAESLGYDDVRGNKRRDKDEEE
jgi:RNA polymerase sigma factor (sigma-70 family)